MNSSKTSKKERRINKPQKRIKVKDKEALALTNRTSDKHGPAPINFSIMYFVVMVRKISGMKSGHCNGSK